MIISNIWFHQKINAIHGLKNIGKRRIFVNFQNLPTPDSIRTIRVIVQVRKIFFLLQKKKRSIVISDMDSFSNLSVPYFQEGYVHYVVDAVFTLVIAVQKLIDEKCSNGATGTNFCEEFFPLDGARLLNILRNVTFRNGK